MKFYGEFEIISSTHSIITLHDESGNWEGSERVEIKFGFSLYEESYRIASQKAALKKGRLERFSKKSLKK